MRITVGTSAALTNQSLLLATVVAGDHPMPARSANLSTKSGSACLSQLTSTPRLDVVSCGAIEVVPVGGPSGSTFTLQAGGDDAVVGCDVSRLLPPQAAAMEVTARHQAIRMSVIRSVTGSDLDSCAS